MENSHDIDLPRLNHSNSVSPDKVYGVLGTGQLMTTVQCLLSHSASGAGRSRQYGRYRTTLEPPERSFLGDISIWWSAGLQTGVVGRQLWTLIHAGGMWAEWVIPPAQTCLHDHRMTAQLPLRPSKVALASFYEYCYFMVKKIYRWLKWSFAGVLYE